MKKPPTRTGPVRIAGLIAEGKLLWVYCRDCSFSKPRAGRCACGIRCGWAANRERWRMFERA